MQLRITESSHYFKSIRRGNIDAAFITCDSRIHIPVQALGSCYTERISQTIYTQHSCNSYAVICCG